MLECSTEDPTVPVVSTADVWSVNPSMVCATALVGGDVAASAASADLAELQRISQLVRVSPRVCSAALVICSVMGAADVIGCLWLVIMLSATSRDFEDDRATVVIGIPDGRAGLVGTRDFGAGDDETPYVAKSASATDVTIADSSPCLLAFAVLTFEGNSEP